MYQWMSQKIRRELGQVKGQATGPDERIRRRGQAISPVIGQEMGLTMIQEKGQVTRQGMYQVKDQVMGPDDENQPPEVAKRYARQFGQAKGQGRVSQS